MSFRPFYDGPSYGTSGGGSSALSSASSSSSSDHNHFNNNMRRRNDGLAGFASPESEINHHTDSAYPPYNELPFTSLKRRRQREKHSFVRWTMRAVLASPVVVLCLWSLAAFSFTSKNSSAMNSVPRQMSATAGSSAAASATNLNGNTNVLIVPQPAATSTSAASAATSGMMLSNTQLNPEQYMMANSNGAISSKNVVPEQPLLATGTDGSTTSTVRVVQPPNLQVAVSNAVPMTTTSTNPAAAASTSTSTVMNPPAQQQSAPVMTTTKNKKDKNIKARPRPAPRAPSSSTTTKTSTSTTTQATPQLQQHQQVYYYDPAQAITQSGSLQVPSVVYDAHGNAVPLQALQASEIYLEPPKATSTSTSTLKHAAEDAAELTGEVAASLLTAAQPATTVDAPALTMMQTPESWGESSAQDQSIIISTVAVMALLVGALSAKRMRSRSFLSSCIENESLEDDAAYDTAYTHTTSSNTAVDNSYNTFGGWRGDLEKFDV